MTSTTPAPPSATSPVPDLIPKFILTRLLSSDQAGRRISLLGTIDNLPALLIAERAAFDTSPAILTTFPTSLHNITTLGANDIYFWFLANSAPSPETPSTTPPPPPDYKINLIYPCTEKHITKYSPQRLRIVTETPALYTAYIRPYMAAQRAKGTLTWIYNILDGKTEQEDVIYRSPAPPLPNTNNTTNNNSNNNNNNNNNINDESSFLLLPDLNWDRKTISTLHLLGLVARRDLWSVRDLTKPMVPWLRAMQRKMVDATVQLYASRGLEADELKCYVHYQPTYYHFHIHIVHVSLEAGGTQATGKALGLDNVVSQLDTMGGGRDDNDNDNVMGMQDASLTYHVGERSELWEKVYLPLKEGREVDVGGF